MDDTPQSLNLTQKISQEEHLQCKKRPCRITRNDNAKHIEKATPARFFEFVSFFFLKVEEKRAERWEKLIQDLARPYPRCERGKSATGSNSPGRSS